MREPHPEPSRSSGNWECKAEKGRRTNVGKGWCCFFFFQPVKFSAGGSLVKSKQPLEFTETWILVARLRLTHRMTLGNPYFFLDLDFLNSSRKWLQKVISQSPGSSGILWPKDRLSAISQQGSRNCLVTSPRCLDHCRKRSRSPS